MNFFFFPADDGPIDAVEPVVRHGGDDRRTTAEFVFVDDAFSFARHAPSTRPLHDRRFPPSHQAPNHHLWNAFSKGNYDSKKIKFEDIDHVVNYRYQEWGKILHFEKNQTH